MSSIPLTNDISRDLAGRLRESAAEQGLHFFGAVTLDCEKDFARFQRWIDENRHGGMTYLEKHAGFRQRPGELLPGARAALVFGLPYFQPEVWPKGDFTEGPRVAQYARFADYHRVIRRKLEIIVAGISEENGRAEFRILVDSAPVLERAMAAHGAEGFIGKNTCFIHPRRGSFFLLSEVLTTLPFGTLSREFDSRRRGAEGGCGPCTLCQTKCPTGALDDDYRIDATKCLAYWTIEHRGTIPEKFWPHLRYYYFGCDICQLVCPYNGAAAGGLPSTITPREFPSLYEVATMDQARYELYFGGTAATRAKRNGLRRNALIAMTVTHHPGLDAALAVAEADGGEPVAGTLRQIRRWRDESGLTGGKFLR